MPGAVNRLFWVGIPSLLLRRKCIFMASEHNRPEHFEDADRLLHPMLHDGDPARAGAGATSFFTVSTRPLSATGWWLAAAQRYR